MFECVQRHKCPFGGSFQIAAFFFVNPFQENRHLFAHFNQVAVGVVKTDGPLAPKVRC